MNERYERYDEELEPLDSDLDALLSAERAAEAPSASLDRVWSRVAAGGAVGAGGGRTGLGWLAAHPAALVVGAFLLGGVGGAALHASLQKAPPAQIVYVDRPAPVGSALPIAPSPAPPPALPPVAPTPPHAVRGPSPSASASSLAAERALLDAARAALGAGSAGKALGLLDDHARRFPRGQLGEEREALAIQSLASLGRADDARARAARFRATSPNSLFLPAVDATLATIP